MAKENFGAIKLRKVNTLIVGSGAAAYNAANRLWESGVRDVLMVTENRLSGTSRNTGSDKQTYYKLSLGGRHPDSVEAMAAALYNGCSVDGDICLAEAANSVRCFMNLVEKGVPFPFDETGTFFGYRTDHDESERASSVGPLTSKAMTECLEKTAKERAIEQLNKCLVVKIITRQNKLYGVLAFLFDGATQDNLSEKFLFIQCENLVYATGGPASIYSHVVYPAGHYGMSGIAFEAGVKGRNLTEWQYGLASINPRWNVSGTYMQSLPRFVSMSKEGSDPKEFLSDYYSKRSEVLNNIFLKGYQWPFDVRKLNNGSSMIDILVYQETILKGRRVFLDFTENPGLVDINAAELAEEQKNYLKNNDAIFGKPIDRLRKMNEPAYHFYLSKGIDLAKDFLEIAICAQHNNGGLAVDSWWQTNVEGFYACGEVAGTHGIYRPGGAALNSGQVGSLRAAQSIARKQKQIAQDLPQDILAEVQQFLSNVRNLIDTEENCRNLWAEMSNAFFDVAGPIRNQGRIKAFLNKVIALLNNFDQIVKVSSFSNLFYFYHFRDTLISQAVYCHAILDYMEKGGQSRGSALYIDPQGSLHHEDLWPDLNFELDQGQLNEKIQEVGFERGVFSSCWRQRKPLLIKELTFETAWRQFRKENGME
ncbi:MAG: FAD-binding protein [Anaerolineaceae bacterium]|nr:FAD-binding protein [Anaerolineaceae bacterium]